MAAVLFPYRPVTPLVERWNWSTDLIEAMDGTETRRAVRDVPRQSWEWDVWVTDRDYYALLRGQHYQTFLVPAWHEGEVTVAQITAGASTVVVDTDKGDWRTTLIIWTSETACETINISSVGSDIINLATNVQATYAAGAVVAPIRIARLANVVRQQDDKQLTHLTLTWLITDPTVFDDYDWTTQHLDEDVLTTRYLLDGGEFAGRSLTAAVHEYDYGTGDPYYEVQYNHDVWGMPSMVHQLTTAEEAWEWKQWFHKMQGRFGDFWVPTWKSDIVIAAAFTATDSWLTIENNGYVAYLDALDACKNIYFQRHGDLAPLTRFILESAAVDADTEKIRLNDNLGFAGGAGSFEYISWLHPCRLAADQVEMSFSPGAHARISVPIRERPVVYPDPEPGAYTIALYAPVLGSYIDDYDTILQALGWNTVQYLDGNLPAVGTQTFDAIFAIGFGISQAVNGALLRSYEAAGVPVLVGNSASSLSSNFGSLAAEMGFATNSNSGSSLNIDPSFHQVAGHLILNGSTQDADTGDWSMNTRTGNPQAVGPLWTTSYGGKDWIWDDATPIGTTVAWARIPTDDPADRRGIGIIAVDAGEDGFTTRCLWTGHCYTQDTPASNMTADGKNLLHNMLKWIIGDFDSYTAIPLVHSDLDRFEDGLPSGAVEFWNASNGAVAALSSVDAPNTYTGYGLEITGTDQYIYQLDTTSGDWEFHCQFIYRDLAVNNRVGFAFNCAINHQTAGGDDILDGYTYQLDNADGNLFRWYATFADPDWVQSSALVWSTSEDWAPGDELLNFQMQYVSNTLRIRRWIEGEEAPPGAWGGGGTSLTDHTSGTFGLYIELGNPTAKAEFSYWKIFTP